VVTDIKGLAPGVARTFDAAGNTLLELDFGRLTYADEPITPDELADRQYVTARQVVHTLLDGKAHEGTVMLVEQAASGRHLTVTNAIDTFVELAARSRDRVVALVRVAQPLAEDEEKRLAAALSAQYDRTVHLNTVVDPSVIGGVHITVGDEVVDGTVSSRLAEAGRRLAG